MDKTEIKNKIDSISYIHNRYIKNQALNLCDEILISKFLGSVEKKEVQKIKTKIEKSRNTTNWYGQPDYAKFDEILDYLYDLYLILD